MTIAIDWNVINQTKQKYGILERTFHVTEMTIFLTSLFCMKSQIINTLFASINKVFDKYV